MGSYRHIFFTSASLLTLAISGCMDGTDTASDTAGEATAFSERPSSSRLVERDVEAPEVFQTTDQGLWDGRPSLGGVWVAYPDVTDPERVIIRNDANGKFVIGALFKREREHPGPKLQVSSDAASALGMLAGSPTSINVTALRREEPAPVEEQAEEAIAAVEPAAAATATTAAEASDDAVATAAAAIEQAETTTDGEDIAAAATEMLEAEPKKRGWNPFKRTSSESPAAEDTLVAAVDSSAADVSEATALVVETAAAADTMSEQTVEPLIEPVQKKRGWNPFKRKQTETVTPAAATASTALAAGAITSQSLDAAPRVADEPAAAPQARNTTSKLDKPYVQIGIFSVESNANNTATALRQNGVVPQVYKQESSGKTFWRVVAGPSGTKVDRSALVKKVKSMGFADAYPVGG